MKFDSSSLLLILSLASVASVATAADTCTTTLPPVDFGPYDDNPQCVSDFGFDFGWKMDGCQDGSFPLNKRPWGGGEVKGSCAGADEIILDVECTHKSANLDFKGLAPENKAIVKVKGGNGGTIYEQKYTMQGLIAGMNGGGSGIADISHIEICLMCVDPDECEEEDTPAPTTTTPVDDETTSNPTNSPTDSTPEPTTATPEVTPAPTTSPVDATTGTPTPAPKPTPTVIVDDPPVPTRTKEGSTYGDPHFKTWGGEVYDFHGGCDLVLVDAPTFARGKGLLVHVRTKIITWWSYIDSAVLKIGDDTFEIKGGHNQVHYWVNGKPGALTNSGMVESTVGGYPIKFRNVSKKQKSFRFQGLPQGVGLAMESFGDFVRVKVWAKSPRHFKGAKGLLGLYPDGAMVGRDGETIISDPVAFGNEWQVRLDEDHLFHSLEGAQHPQKCQMPTETEDGRRLGESNISEEDAKIACADVPDPQDFDACVFDVLATSNLDLAGSYGSW